MIRTYLCEGDKAGNAVIIEGLDTSTYQDEITGRDLRMATVNMKTYCHSCKKIGDYPCYRLPAALYCREWRRGSAQRRHQHVRLQTISGIPRSTRYDHGHDKRGHSADERNSCAFERCRTRRFRR